MENKAVSRTAVSCLAALILIAAASYNFAKFQSATPEQLIADLQEAARKGDIEGFLSGLTAESRKIVEKSYADRPLSRHAQEEFRRALDERFGKGAEMLTAPEDDLRTAIGRIVSAEVVSKKDGPDGSVEFEVKTTVNTGDEKTATREDTLVARKEDGAWKLALRGFPADRRDADQIKATIERFTADVRNGKYPDRMAAMLALDNALIGKEGNK